MTKQKHQPMTMQQIADKLGCKLRSVQRWRIQLGLGTPFNRTYLLTQDDADKIASHVRSKSGNPNFVAKEKPKKKGKKAKS
jgi:hypothetical protein